MLVDIESVRRVVCVERSPLSASYPSSEVRRGKGRDTPRTLMTVSLHSSRCQLAALLSARPSRFG